MKKQKVCHLLLFVSILFVFVFVGCDPNPDSTKTPSSNEDNQNSSNEDNQNSDSTPTSGGASFPKDFRGTWVGNSQIDTEEVDEDGDPISIDATIIVDIEETKVETRLYFYTDHKSADQYDLVEYTSTSFKLKNTASVDENGKWGEPTEDTIVISYDFAEGSTTEVEFTLDGQTFSMEKTEFSQPDFLKGTWTSDDDGEITLADEYEFEAGTEKYSGTWDASYTESDGKYSGILRTVTEVINEGSGFSLGGASPYELYLGKLTIWYPDGDPATGIFDVEFEPAVRPH